MYSPVLSRFQSRDPLPIEGEPDILYGEEFVSRMLRRMPNLYAYAENRPTRFIDPSGLTISYSPPVEGHPWSDEKLGGLLGGTRMDWRINCSCHAIEEERCLADSKCKGKVDCDVTLITTISLDRNAIKKDPKYNDGVTIPGTYGHEQRHAKCFYDMATATINGTLAGSVFRYKSRTCTTGCAPFVAQVAATIERALKTIRTNVKNLAYPCSPGRYSDDPPIGQMPPTPIK